MKFVHKAHKQADGRTNNGTDKNIPSVVNYMWNG